MGRVFDALRRASATEKSGATKASTIKFTSTAAEARDHGLAFRKAD